MIIEIEIKGIKLDFHFIVIILSFIITFLIMLLIVVSDNTKAIKKQIQRADSLHLEQCKTLERYK